MTIPSTEPAPGGEASPPAASPPARAGLGRHLALVLLVAALAGGLLGGFAVGVSAALGVTLAAANLLLMRRITAALTGGGGSAWMLALPFKMLALVGAAYALVSSGVAQPVPLAIGFALLPLTAVFLPRPGDTGLAQASSRALSPGTILPGRAGNH